MISAKYIVLALTIFSLVVVNTAWSEAKPPMDSAGIMTTADLNGDNRIDLEEYRDRITDVYFFMDANKDGKLTVVEIQKSYPSLDSDVIDNTDVNADTVITIYEFRYVLYKDFEVMDRNKDGSLDQEEIKSAMEEE